MKQQRKLGGIGWTRTKDSIRISLPDVQARLPLVIT